jgi:UPF0716 protein FxsA
VFIRLSLLLIVVPMVELVLLLTLADMTGFEVPLALVIGTALGGAWLLRRQGLKTLRSIRTELRGGRLPPNEILDGVLILIAGVLLLTPGILTDLVGISLLIPTTRAVFRRWLVTYFKSRLQIFRFPNSSGSAAESSEIIDSYVVSSSEEPKAEAGNKHTA